MTASNAKLKNYWQVNGEFGASLPMADRGLAYGDGLFETMRFQKGLCALADEHWARLLKGCERLSITLDKNRLLADLQSFLNNIQKQEPNLHGIVKLIVTRGAGGKGYLPPENSKTTLIWQWLPAAAPSTDAQNGVSLCVSDVRLAKQKLLAGLKHLNRLEYVLAADRAPAGQLPLLLDADEYVIETLSHNVFLVREGEVITPHLMHCGVEGVLKQFAQQKIAPSLNINMREACVSLNELMAADEVFIGNSVRGFWPITQLTANKKIVNWSIGNICRQFQKSHQLYLQSVHG